MNDFRIENITVNREVDASSQTLDFQVVSQAPCITVLRIEVLYHQQFVTSVSLPVAPGPPTYVNLPLQISQVDLNELSLTPFVVATSDPMDVGEGDGEVGGEEPPN